MLVSKTEYLQLNQAGGKQKEKFCPLLFVQSAVSFLTSKCESKSRVYIKSQRKMAFCLKKQFLPKPLWLSG